MNVFPHYSRWLLLVAIAAAVAPACPAAAQNDSWDDFEPLPLWRVRAEYLHWWTSGNPLPPLVTTSPPGTPRTDAGVLGTPGAEILVGGETIDTGARSGGRITISRWLEDEEETILEFVGFYVGDDYQSGDFDRFSPGSPIISRPFFNAQSGLEDAELVAFNGIIEGRVTIDSFSEIYSAAPLIRQNIGLGPRGRIDVLAGYRYFKLRESLEIREALESIDPGGVIPLGTTTDLSDQFSAGTDFHGAEAGLSAEFFWPTVSLEMLAKIAIGGIYQKAVIAGQTTVVVPGDPAIVTPGGLLALPTNIGTYDEAKFGFLPEFGLNATVALTPDLTFLTGYSLIILSDALRTGHTIDRVVNTSQIGGDPLMGPPRPAFLYQDSSVILQGINLGLEYRW